jgi:hypothetical protein
VAETGGTRLGPGVASGASRGLRGVSAKAGAGTVTIRSTTSGMDRLERKGNSPVKTLAPRISAPQVVKTRHRMTSTRIIGSELFGFDMGVPYKKKTRQALYHLYQFK